jgi:class 3 adenylate cyclase/tetratricopeptide (TPR) repeat protein
MKCPKCQNENREKAVFCGKCGAGLSTICPECNCDNPPENSFCDKCGHNLKELKETPSTDHDQSHVYESLTDSAPNTPSYIEGERKYVTVLFSDMSGYTVMSERLDPEDVKEITSRIFARISKIIDKYEGFVEKFIGDAVMALFGVPKAHEDDPVRAIQAAREIHDLVEALSPELEGRVGRPLAMHTGINTGIVVTGEVDMDKGTHGVAGDSINLASRLSGLAKEGEILVSPHTYRQAEGYFTFEALEPTTVKGKTEPVQFYKVISQKQVPVTTHRLSGVRADLIGRKVELTELREAVEHLETGKGGIFSICGDAGTGKSRLVEDFKASLDLEKIQWLEGHAYAYARNIPYFPLIDLLNRVFKIEEGDSKDEVRQKVESGLAELVGKKEGTIPYIGGLYSLSYSEIEAVSPEFWKARLRDAVQMIIPALSRRAPTIFFLEDLHWADSSFVELLRHVLIEVRQPAIVLCAYRPVFSLFSTEQARSMTKVYHEIRLQDLSSSEAQGMLESLLKTESIPSDLRGFVQDKAEGNPFYLEELVNSLIETETLIRDNGSWKVTRSITETDISSTINGVISGRLDRLEKETKRVLQEASVIGRSFFYEILKRVTTLKQDIDGFLRGLERLDIIRTRSLQPDLEYMFKHNLTQEVVYNSLLKKERQEAHERIALVMEQLFSDRLPEYCETLAFHFKQGGSTLKAVDYLIKSGEKSLKRYAVEESHQYFEEAFDLLTAKSDRTREEDGLLIGLLIKWALVFYYRGDFKGLTDFLYAHQDLAETLDDKAKLGMFHAWLGWSLEARNRLRESYDYLLRALALGEEIRDQEVVGYACTWLAWTCPFLGLLDEALKFGERGHEIAKSLPDDHYLYFKSLAGIGFARCFMGDGKRAIKAGELLLDYGERHSNIRSMTMGHYITGLGHNATGDIPSAIKSFEKAVQVSADPYYSQFPRCNLGISYLFDGRFQEAEDAQSEVLNFSRDFGTEVFESMAYACLGVVSIVKGHMGHGVKMLEESIRSAKENESKYLHSFYEILLGMVYLQIVQGEGERKLSTMFRNIGFLAKNVPFAGKKGEDHFNKAIEVSKEIGAKFLQGRASLNLGLLHKAKKRTEEARQCMTEAVQLFEACEAEPALKQAKEALASLE